MEYIPGDHGKREALNGKKREVDNEGRYDVRRSPVCIVGCFSHEDKSLLDEGWNGIIGREEDKTDCKDIEIKKPVHCLQAIVSQVWEERREDESHNQQNDLTGEEELWGADDIEYVPP